MKKEYAKIDLLIEMAILLIGLLIGISLVFLKKPAIVFEKWRLLPAILDIKKEGSK